MGHTKGQSALISASAVQGQLVHTKVGEERLSPVPKEFESLHKSNTKTTQTYETTPAFTEPKSEFPQISHWHGTFQEKNEIKWIGIFI